MAEINHTKILNARPEAYPALVKAAKIQAMKNKSLTATNPFLKDPVLARKRIVRSIASSTAIETGESIEVIEKKLNQKPSRYQVALA